MADPRRQLGLDGEQHAEAYLRRQGCKTLLRRFATPVGELDLVMRDGDMIVFVEVKTLRSREFADPQDAVRADKQRKMARCARWLIEQRRWHNCPCRFDVVAVILPETGAPEIEHFPDAFQPAGW